MKKVILIILMLFPFIVKADELKVVNHYIDAEIEIAGALNVKELIITEGTGEFLQRTLNYYSFGDKKWQQGNEINLDNGIIYNGQSINIVKISAYEFNDKIEFGSFDKNITEYFNEFNIKKPSSKSYTFNDKNDGTASLKVFYPVKNKKIAFYINYIVTNVVVKHNDIKEINYSFKNLNYNSKSTYLRVLIPYPTSNELYKVWVHGNQSGEVKELVTKDELKTGIFASFPKVDNSINFRMSLPQEQVGVDMFLNKTEQDALDEIIKIENEKAKITTRSNNIIKTMKYILIIFSILYVIGSLIFMKLNIKIIYILYLLIGIVIIVFNYLFKFNYWYLYITILFPIIIKIINKYLSNKKS